jgi:hypothetical protein
MEKLCRLSYPTETPLRGSLALHPGRIVPTAGSSASRRFRRRLDYLDVPAGIGLHGFLSIAVPVDDVVIPHEADDSASAVQLMVTSPAQHRDPFVAQHTVLAYYPTTDRPNAHADSLLEQTTVLGLARSVDTVCVAGPLPRLTPMRYAHFNLAAAMLRSQVANQGRSAADGCQFCTVFVDSNKGHPG